MPEGFGSATALIAGGNIPTCVFIKLDSTANNQAIVAGAGDQTFGVSSEGAQAAPIPGASANAAAASDSFNYFGQGEHALLTIGSGGCNNGDKLKSDGSGFGIVTTTPGDWYGAIATEICIANDKGNVVVQGGYI